MALFAALLSGSSGGQNIPVAATASTGTTIHATDTSATIYHRVYLFASNSSTADVLLTLEWGGTSTGDLIRQTVTAQAGLQQLVDNLPLVGTGAAARTVRAYAGSANVININGWVNKHTTS